MSLTIEVQTNAHAYTKTDTCFSGHSCPGAPLLEYHSNRLPLQEWEMLKIEKTASLSEASARHAVQLAADTGSVTSAT